MNDVDSFESGQGETPAVDSSAPADAGALAPSSSPTIPSTAPPSPADQFFEVKIGGQSRKVPLNELLSGYSRTQDYTQKTMSLAEERRQIQAQVSAEREQYKSFLSKAENVKQLYDYLLQQQGSNNPNAPLTTQQLQTALAAERQAREQERGQIMEDLRNEQLTNSYKVEIDKSIQDILGTHPELRSIQMIDRILKQAALKNEPATVEDAKAYMVSFAKEQADRIRAHFTEQAKVAAVNKNTLTSRGTEPPGGAAPGPSSKPAYKLGDPRLAQDATEYLKQLMNESK